MLIKVVRVVEVLIVVRVGMFTGRTGKKHHSWLRTANGEKNKLTVK